MADVDATNPMATVRLWIRRTSEPQGPYAIRFEVVDGKGILRVVRPGVLVDPPARPTGFEERLTAAQVGATRFLHVWDGGRSRQAHALTRLSEPQLEALPIDGWVALAFVAEGAASVLVLPAPPEIPAVPAAGAEPARVDDEPTWPRREMLAELQRELRELEVKEVENDRTEIRSVPPEAMAPPPVLFLPPATPAGDATPDAPASAGRSSRAEVVEIVPRAAPRTAPEAPREPVREAARDASKPYTSLDAWLNAPIPTRSEGNGDEEQTILMGGSALAIDRMDGAREPARTALPALAPVPPPPAQGAEELLAIEAGEAADEESGDFELVALEAGPGPLEALEAPSEEEEEEDARVAEREARFHEVTDLGRPAAPENLHRGQITEPVTVIPLFTQDAADESVAAPPDTIEAGDAGTQEDAGADEPDPYALAPKAEFHERNTTLVRFLRRRIAADRARITALEGQVAELEARLARRAAH